jgi:hypothetical protein
MTTTFLAISTALLASMQAPVVVDTTVPHVRAHHAIAYHPGERRVLLTSGSTPLDSAGSRYFFFDDTWGFDGRQWTLLSRSDREMSGVRLAWDSRRQRMLSFGGYLGRTSIGDLRVLENGRWRVLGVLNEMATAESGFVYDSLRDRIVAFGGGAGRGQAHGDTWEYDGSQWLRWQGTSPPARQGHAMVYDAHRNVTVLIGGMGVAAEGQPPPRLDDVWEFDGTTWRQVVFTGGPGPRFAGGATWDPDRRVVLLFGGLDGNGMRNDLWSWDGTTWRLLAESGPPARAMGALAYDEARDRLVLFGGRRGWPDDLNDTWEWDGRAWHEVVR